MNKMKDKYYTTISVDAEKSFDRVHPLMLKILNKLSIEEMYIDIIKVMCDNPIANIVLSGAKLKAFSNTRNKIECRPSPCLVTECWKSQPEQSCKKKKSKAFSGKGRSKTVSIYS